MCLSMLCCAGRYREIETITRIARSSDLIIISLISSIVLSSSLLSAVSRLIVQLVSSMLHLSRVSSRFPYSSSNTTVVTSLIASHYFVAANHDNVWLIMFKVSFLFTVPRNFPGWWVETREKLLNGLTYLARHLTMRVSTSGIPDAAYGICTVRSNKGDVSAENFFSIER